MTVPFIMAMGVGLASVRADKNASSDAFGLVALVALTPLIAIQLMGILYQIKTRDRQGESVLRTVPADYDRIIDFEEE